LRQSSAPNLPVPHQRPPCASAIPHSVFDHARAAFSAAGHTLENVRRDFPEWHLGRPRYALWAVDVDLPPVRAAASAAAAHLNGLLLAGYHRQPHITLGLCGFPTPEPHLPDDFGPAALAAQLDALQTLAPEPFDVHIAQLASFTSAPFLAVRDAQGGIGRLRRALAGDSAEGSGPYTPHVTVGLYAGGWPVADVLARLDAFQAGPPLCCRIERINLMSYAAPEIGGRLTTLAEFTLADGRLSWHPAGTSSFQHTHADALCPP